MFTGHTCHTDSNPASLLAASYKSARLPTFRLSQLAIRKLGLTTAREELVQPMFAVGQVLFRLTRVVRGTRNLRLPQTVRTQMTSQSCSLSSQSPSDDSVLDRFSLKNIESALDT
jgi:hypothetical protein